MIQFEMRLCTGQLTLHGRVPSLGIEAAAGPWLHAAPAVADDAPHPPVTIPFEDVEAAKRGLKHELARLAREHRDQAARFLELMSPTNQDPEAGCIS